MIAPALPPRLVATVRLPRLVATVLLACAPLLAAHAKAPVKAPAPVHKTDAADGAALAARAGLSGRLGFIVVDVASGKVLEALEPDLPLAPASVAKIPTTLYALRALGPQHRFVTQVVAAGKIRDGRLTGDLVLRGGGDPELDTDALAQLAQDARAQVRAVDGAFVVEAGREIGSIDDSLPPEASYNPAVGPLNLNFNRVRLAWERKGGNLTHSIEAHATHASPPVGTVSVTLAPADCGCPVFGYSAGEAETWRVRANALNGEGSVWLPVRSPAAYAGDVFRTEAALDGLALPAPRVAAHAPDGAVIARHESAPLVGIVANMLRYSTNISAEALGLAASAAHGGPARDLAASGAAMSAWAAKYAGFAPGPDFAFVNHSGLTPDTRISPRRMADLLRAAERDPVAGARLIDLLRPHAIDERGAPGPKGAEVRAKTGTLDFTRGLAGYARTASGRLLAFAYFANDLDRRAATRGLHGRPPGAAEWRNRAQVLERALLRSWLVRFDRG